MRNFRCSGICNVGGTGGSGTAYPFGTVELIPLFSKVRGTRSLNFLCIVFSHRCLSFVLLLAIVLSVLLLAIVLSVLLLTIVLSVRLLLAIMLSVLLLLAIVLSVLLRFTAANYHFGILTDVLQT